MQFKISFSPHIRDKSSTFRIMGDVFIALIPSAAFGIYNFGFNALIVILCSIATAVLTEFLWEKLTRKPVTISDFSAMVTGLILALNLPPTVPFWIPIIGSFFAILILKQLFGGLGQNFINPALGAKCLLLITFSSIMSTFVYDGVVTQTPLAVLRAGGEVNLFQLFLGNTSGCIGTTCSIAILVGGIYLLYRRVVDFRIPLFYILTVSVVIVVYSFFTRGGFDGQFLLSNLLVGDLLFGAFFMATDYVTGPISPSGRIIFAVILGILTCTFRLFGGSIEDVAYSIVLCNFISPLIDKVTATKSFGKGADIR